MFRVGLDFVYQLDCHIYLIDVQWGLKVLHWCWGCVIRFLIWCTCLNGVGHWLSLAMPSNTRLECIILQLSSRWWVQTFGGGVPSNTIGSQQTYLEGYCMSWLWQLLSTDEKIQVPSIATLRILRVFGVPGKRNVKIKCMIHCVGPSCLKVTFLVLAKWAR